MYFISENDIKLEMVKAAMWLADQHPSDDIFWSYQAHIKAFEVIVYAGGWETAKGNPLSEPTLWYYTQYEEELGRFFKHINEYHDRLNDAGALREEKRLKEIKELSARLASLEGK